MLNYFLKLKIKTHTYRIIYNNTNHKHKLIKVHINILILRSKYLVLGPGARKTFQLSNRTPPISFNVFSRKYIEKKCTQKLS